MSRYQLFISAVAALMVISASSCSKKTKPEEPVAAATTTNADENATTGDSDSGKAMGLQTVHFAYDNFTLDPQAKQTLQGDGSILKSHGAIKVQIEGHCDQRGGIQYNIALGEKRANATKAFLVDDGIQGDRITTISFGKERPLDTSESEAAYAKNRRANFVITAH